LSKSLGFLTRNLVPGAMEQRHHHMQSLAARGLAKAFHANGREVLPHGLRGLDDVGKSHVWRGIEIENQPAWRVVRIRGTVPRMQLKSAGLRHRGKPLDAIDLQIGLSVTGYPHQLEQL